MMTLPFLAARSTDVITLRGGHVVSVRALQLLWDLENRQFNLQADGDLLLVRPGSRLTLDDNLAIREHQDELLALVRYCEVV